MVCDMMTVFSVLTKHLGNTCFCSLDTQPENDCGCKGTPLQGDGSVSLSVPLQGDLWSLCWNMGAVLSGQMTHLSLFGKRGRTEGEGEIDSG